MFLVLAIGEKAVVIARPALSHFTTSISQLSNANLEIIAKFALDSLKPRAMYYGEEVHTPQKLKH